MGITNVTIASLKEALPANLDVLKLSLCELGDQRFYLEKPFVYQDIEMQFLKSYFDLLGCPHISIDYHGNNGALKLDFRQAIPERMVERYDILTNFGFTEHVDNQFMAWKNINDLIKVGGKIICELPGQAKFPGHHECPYYTMEFFQSLSVKCGYEIDALRYQQHTVPLAGQVVWAVITKTRSEFITQEEFAEVEAKLGRN